MYYDSDVSPEDESAGGDSGGLSQSVINWFAISLLEVSEGCCGDAGPEPYPVDVCPILTSSETMVI